MGLAEFLINNGARIKDLRSIGRNNLTPFIMDFLGEGRIRGEGENRFFMIEERDAEDQVNFKIGVNQIYDMIIEPNRSHFIECYYVKRNNDDIDKPYGHSDCHTLLFVSEFGFKELSILSVVIGNAYLNVASNHHYSPLFYVAEHEESYELLKFFLERGGADVNLLNIGSQETAIYRAITSNNTESLRLLIENGANPNVSKRIKKDSFWFFYSPLHIAAQNRNAGLIRSLIAKGANPIIRDENLNTPLHFAAGNITPWQLEPAYNSDVMHALLKGTGIVAMNYKNKEGETALSIFVRRLPEMIITERRSLWVANTINLFLEFGADPNNKDKNGNTLFHYIIGELSDLILNERDEEIVYKERIKLLAQPAVRKGANPNLKDKNGNTPLHHAAISGDSDIIGLLVNNGANANVQNNDGFTPYGYAVYYEEGEDIITALQPR